jgi:hypothetical protein
MDDFAKCEGVPSIQHGRGGQSQQSFLLDYDIALADLAANHDVKGSGPAGRSGQGSRAKEVTDEHYNINGGAGLPPLSLKLAVIGQSGCGAITSQPF